MDNERCGESGSIIKIKLVIAHIFSFFLCAVFPTFTAGRESVLEFNYCTVYVSVFCCLCCVLFYFADSEICLMICQS